MPYERITINIKPPCGRNCPGRNAECHTKCEKYLEYVQKCKKFREDKRRDMEIVEVRNESYNKMCRQFRKYRYGGKVFRK